MTDIDEEAFKLAFFRKNQYTRTSGIYRHAIERYEKAKKKLQEMKGEENAFPDMPVK